MAEAESTYIVKRPVLHGDKKLATGDRVIFNKHQAQSLLDDGAITPLVTPAPATEVIDLSLDKTSGDDRNAGDWTQRGDGTHYPKAPTRAETESATLGELARRQKR